jgi:hypothetical protein
MLLLLQACTVIGPIATTWPCHLQPNLAPSWHPVSLSADAQAACFHATPLAAGLATPSPPHTSAAATSPAAIHCHHRTGARQH